jgi:hypothetical protein
MKCFIWLLLVSIAFVACNDDIPNVSNIKVNIQTQRFEKDFFALDTNQVDAGMAKLDSLYPGFAQTYFIQILGVDPRWGGDTIATYVKEYIKYSKTIYDSAQLLFNDFKPFEKQVVNGLQFVKHYYPNYKIPSKIYTFIGPTDGAGDGIGEDFLSIGLQAHLGKDFPIYQTDMVRNVYPSYITANFTPDFIAVNSLKNIVQDMYPDKNEDKRLIVQMVENGKRLFLLQKFLPKTDEHLLMGYSKNQLKQCYDNEAKIWDLFIQNNYLQLTDNNLIKTYVSEGPKTAELGENAPGNLGSFAGWQIVKKYAKMHKDIEQAAIMQTNAEIIYKESKYKP